MRARYLIFFAAGVGTETFPRDGRRQKVEMAGKGGQPRPPPCPKAMKRLCPRPDSNPRPVD